MTCGVSQDIICLTAQETWVFEDTLHGTDGSTLNLTGAVVTLHIYGNGADFLGAMNIESPPTDGTVNLSISPAQQITALLNGYATYFFLVRAVLASGEVTFQNRGLVYVASYPGS